ncbi:ABC transporter ATP-binding protein [Rhizomonospora bruguierae]|uniref:ABC transporter ATP-binding protein n=1 Tax=Rhizomonospora bruguierae TaxID=1581705 RepID=UPI001BCF7935|nr:ABC transporter ATP-binding protein [Micromonospora sp. NBRC 107566]
MSAVLTLDAVSAFYGPAQVLRDVSLSIESGEAVALVGRNGAGKSTLAMALYGIPRVEGSIFVGGEPLKLTRAYHASRAGIALCPQGRRILSNLTVEENLLLGAAHARPGSWNLRSVYALFPILAERARYNGHALSGGQQQMLAIGRALMSNPRVLVLDEPTEGLSPVAIDEVIDALASIGETGTALFLIEQNLRLVSRLASRYVALVKGEVVRAGAVTGESMEELRSTVGV